MKLYPTRLAAFLAGLAISLVAGCATVNDQPYIPAKMGNLNDSLAYGGIKIMLVPDHYQAKIGDLITFSIILKNVSEEPIWIPREPDVLLTWVYPDGKRDNLVRDDEKQAKYTKSNSILLQPGQERTYRSAISTYYFNRRGITEFRALVSANDTANNELNPFWAGQGESNGYGVMLRD
jgi:hypothetical protein